MKKILWYLFCFFCIVIGLYPITYFLIDREFGLLAFKDPELLQKVGWNIFFYGHIIFGGVALLIGWTQFSTKWRTQHINRHRTIGKIYLGSVAISGVSGLYIALYATGGFVSSLGFLCLDIIWLVTTILAYTSIRKKQILQHENYMILSYAACFAAVTLRIWLPILTPLAGGFVPAYRIVAWLSWAPNILVALLIIRIKKI
jgi:uncharacterized membrane protein